MSDAVTVVTWNVLAAPWAAPAFYPAEMDMSVLDRRTRAALVGERLRVLSPDVACLQETTPTDLEVVLAALDGYESFAPPNGRDLWAHWMTPDVPWESNGTAVVWRSRRFVAAGRDALSVSDDGNVAASVRLCDRDSDRVLRVTSVHLDADEPATRRVQLPRILGQLAPVDVMVDVVAGDCNEDTTGTDLGEITSAHDFVDALDACGCFDPTHPYARPGDAWTLLARLDHVLVRGGAPVRAGRVEDSGVWSVDAPGPRMEEHLRRTGSDHLPVVVELDLASEVRHAPSDE
ncbi:MAG: endonuclease/exonuclease/phosphatase family protein [Acidimicrobiia bacterium]